MWILTKKIRSQIEMINVNFLCRMARISHGDPVRSSEVELLLLRIKRNQQRNRIRICFSGHVSGRTEDVPELPVEVITPLWSGNSIRSSRRSWRVLLERGLSYLNCCFQDPITDKQKKTDWKV